LRPLQPSPMFFSKVRAFLSEAPFSVPLYAGLLALSTNIRLGWKDVPRKNTIAYYKHL